MEAQDIDVYFDFSVTPDEFYLELCKLHEEINITDISQLRKELEEQELYELCQVTKDFANDFNIKI